MDYQIIKTIAIGLIFLLPFSSANAQCDPAALDFPNNGIDEDCDLLDGLFLQMPTYIYMVEGKEFDMYYRNLILSLHPSDYVFEVKSTLIGASVFNDHWHFMPTSADVGEHPFTLEVKDANNNVLASASATVRIAPALTPGTAEKKFIQMGHSLVDQGVMIYYLRQHTEEPGTPPVSFHGSRTSSVDGMTHHEGMGGTSWRFYNQDSLSPLVNNNVLNIKSYFDEVVCTNCTPDFMVIQLDVNDYCFTGFVSGKTFEETSDYIDEDFQTNILPIINALRTNAPNMKIGICLTPPANGRPGVFLNHFGSNDGLGDPFRWKKIVNSILEKYTEYFGGREKENIYLLPINLGVDDFKHFNDVDPIHPYPSNGDITKPNGYRSAARDMFAWIKWHMADEAQGICRINAFSKDIICDNNNTPNNSSDDSFRFSLKAENTFGGTSWQSMVNGQNITGSYGNFEQFGPFPTSNPVVLTLSDQNNTACQSLFTVSSPGCSNGTEAKADLELSVSTDNTNPPPFTEFEVEWKIENNSNVPAQGVWLKIPKPAQVSFPNSNSFDASQGEYDWFYKFLWEVGEIPAHGEATLKINYYLLSDDIFRLYGEAYSMVQKDIDSEVHNGDYYSKNEDDEAVLLIGETVSTTTQVQQNFLKIYPNPISKEGFTIETSRLNSKIMSFKIISVHGKTIRSDNQQINNKRHVNINLPNGFYTLQCHMNDGTVINTPFIVML